MTKKTEVYTLTLLFIFVFYCALIIGISWDEIFVMTRGEERLKYIFSLGSYESAYLMRAPNEEFYPGFYATLATFIKKIFPKKFEFEMWHLINSIFSILTIFGIYRVSSILFNNKVGKIVFLLCFLNPIFFGHMAMNSKDTIVALANVWSTYIFLRYLQKQNLEENCNRYILFAGLTIGLGTGIRLPFIVTLVPVFLFAIFDLVFFKKISNKNFSYKKFIYHLIIVLLISYLITISCWPHVHGNVLTEPYKLLLAQIKGQIFGPPWILFNGSYFDTNQLPSLYVIINFFYKSPEFILLSYIIFIYFIITNKFFPSQFDFFWYKIILILFILLFPTIYFILIPYRVYDGLRLFFYLIPYFNIIPGLAIYYLINNLNSLIHKTFLGVTVGLFIYYLFIFISLTPYQYTYLNKFVGDFSNAHKKFENDYWAVSIKELVKKIPNEIKIASSKKKIKIAFCGLPHAIVKLELDKLKNLRYEQKYLFDEDVDYIVMTNKVVETKDDNTLVKVQTCFEKFKGDDLVSVKRNGLILSTIRKRF